MLRALSTFRLMALLLIGVVAVPVGWLIADRLARIADQQGFDRTALGEPAATMVGQPLLTALPGVGVVLVALLGLALPRLRLTAVVLGTLFLLGMVSALGTALIQLLAPLYDVQKL